MELSSNSELLSYASPNGSVDPNECDSFLNEFEVIGRDDDEVTARLNNLAISAPSRAPAPRSLQGSATVFEDAISVSNSSFGSQEDGSQVTHADLTEMVKKYEEENTKLKSLLEDVKKTLQEKNLQFTNLVEDVKKAHEEDRAKYENCRQQDLSKVKQLEMENLDLKQQLNLLKKKVADLEKELADKSLQDNNFTEIVSMETQLKDKQSEIDARDKALDDLKIYLEQEKTQNNELKDYIRNSNIDEKNKQIAEYQAQISALNTTQVERDETIEILKAQMESLQIALAKGEIALNEKDDACIPMRKRLEEKQQEVTMLYNELEDKNARYSHVNQALNEKNTEYDSLCQLLTEKHEQLEELLRAKEIADDICQKYQEKVYLLEEEIRNSKKLIDDFDKENALLKTRVAALTTENESINYWRMQCDLYQADYTNVMDQKNVLNDRIFEMNKEMEELRQKNEQQQQELNNLHSTHIRFAQEHINRDGDQPNEQDTSNSGGANVEGAVGGATSNNTPVQQDSRQNSSTNTATSSDLDPCPICQKQFYSYANLQEHSWNCGRSTVFSSPNLDPFIFVPHQ